jgi:hypothetical protein
MEAGLSLSGLVPELPRPESSVDNELEGDGLSGIGEAGSSRENNHAKDFLHPIAAYTSNVHGQAFRPGSSLYVREFSPCFAAAHPAL